MCVSPLQYTVERRKENTKAIYSEMQRKALECNGKEMRSEDSLAHLYLSGSSFVVWLEASANLHAIAILVHSLTR